MAPMEITRRKVLLGSAGLAGAAAVAGAGIEGARELLPRLRRIASPALPDAAPGPLPPRLRATLLAAVETLLDGADPAAERGAGVADYERMLESRAETVPGYLEVYRRFTREADARAEADGAGSFADAPPARRREILAELCPASRLGRLRAGLSGAAGADRARFRVYLTREVLLLYAASGAWTALGCGAPPGSARDLESYTGPPPGGVST